MSTYDTKHASPTPASPSTSTSPNTLPDEHAIAAAASVLVFDKQGVKLPFGDVFASGRTVVVFIRHFFCGVTHHNDASSTSSNDTYACVHSIPYTTPSTSPTSQSSYITRLSLDLELRYRRHRRRRRLRRLLGDGYDQMCQDYVAQLATVPSHALEEAKTRIVIVGCGDWQLIENYKKTTGFAGSIYADPSRALYHALGMTRETLAGTPKGVQPRSYVGGAIGNAVRSIWHGPMKNPSHIGKQGNLSQLGGDFVLGPGNQCTFAHLMEHTQDHIEVADLMQAVGVRFPLR